MLRPTLLFLSLMSLVPLSGCNSNAKINEVSAAASAEPDSSIAGAKPSETPSAKRSSSQLVASRPAAAGPIELSKDGILAAALSQEELAEGWVRLFDGQSLFGWFAAGDADWQVVDGTIRVTKGERSYLCTSFQMPEYELKLEFRSDEKTNSGIFLRTGPQPEDVAKKSLELNIAPRDNPFPTGSFVQRKKLESKDLDDKLGQAFDPTEWHTYQVRVSDRKVAVSLDGKPVMELKDFEADASGHISLQHNEGRVEFRNILLRPIGRQELKVDEDWNADWTTAQKPGSNFKVTAVEDGLKIQGGLGQVQSKFDFGDFFLQACYSLKKPEVNSGIFFRCIRDNMLDGYECQVNHAVLNGDPLSPADSGAGAIFRRAKARIVVGDGTDHDHISVLANGAHIVTWVNGVQVTDFTDTRQLDENPRRGLRLKAGPISLQGHDPESEVIYHQLQISPF